MEPNERELTYRDIAMHSRKMDKYQKRQWDSVYNRVLENSGGNEQRAALIANRYVKTKKRG